MEGHVNMYIKNIPEMSASKVSMDVNVREIDTEGKVALFRALYQTLECDPLETILIITQLTGMSTGDIPKGKRFYKHKETGTLFDAEFFDKFRDK